MIKLENICKSYELSGEKVTALNNINLQIKEGEFVSIIGKSGSGKSTMLNVLGMLDDWDSGEYTLDGIKASDLKGNEVAKIRNQKMGFVYQNFNLLPKLSAVENVALPLMYSGKSNKENMKVAKEYLELVGLGDKIHNKPTQLSGGQQQRVAIARALVNKPKILFADEPTGALDSKTSKDIMSLIQRVWREQGITVIMVTHDDGLASQANRIIRVSDGQIVE
ncbi:MAG: ABC transporter ATP-binding protein [Peptostreptococcaceae bacterium]|nr:ABC transporter ATP-binding protein [Peptostreptococcaceae bacterium]MBP3929023.1 ABC transporter ATP-binding protein [Peptostreptococcaceae bacterium]